MAIYVYRGRCADGEYVFGQVEAEGMADAVHRLKSSHGVSAIFNLQRQQDAPYMEQIETAKKTIGDFWSRATNYLRTNMLGLVANIKSVQQDRRLSKALDLVKRLNAMDISISEGIIDRSVSVKDDLPDEDVVVAQPEFKKRPVKRRELTEGYAIAWDNLSSPSRGEIRRLKLSSKEVQLLTRRLALLLSSGVSIANALQTFLEHVDNDRMRRMIQSIYDDVQGGRPLSYALLRFPKQFSRLYIAMVIVGETSGTLDRCLIDMADFLDTQQKISQSIKGATIYPRIVLGVMLLLLIAGAKFFIPMFEEMFVDFGMTLPVMTRFIFWFARSLLYIAPITIAIVLAVHLVLRIATKIGDEYLYQRDRLLLKLPVAGDLVMSMSMLHFSHTLSVMLGNGVRLLDSLMMARDVVANKVLQHEVHDAMEQVVEGVNLSEALYRQRNFDPLVASMIYTGEEAGAMDRVLNQTANHYLVRVKEQVDMFVQWVQPMSVLALAVVVIPVVLGIFLPLLDITSGGFMD